MMIMITVNPNEAKLMIFMDFSHLSENNIIWKFISITLNGDEKFNNFPKEIHVNHYVTNALLLLYSPNW